MKKNLFAIAALLLVAIPSFSQNAIDQVEVNAGINFASMTYCTSKVGFHAGVRLTKNLDTLAPGFYANAGALLSLKGGKMDLGELGNATINAYYLDIPVHFGYSYAINDKIKIFGEVGPYFDFGLFGKSKSKEISIYSEYLDDIDYYELSKYLNKYGDEMYEETSYDTFDQLKRFDFGLGFRIGMSYGKYSIALGYDAGLINTYKSSNYNTGDDDYDIDATGTVKNKNFYISLGYTF